MRCINCQLENPPNAKFCLECGTAFARTCSNCGIELPPKAKFCLECGHKVGASDPRRTEPVPDSYTPKHLADKILTSRAALEGERKQVTVLFADRQRLDGTAGRSQTRCRGLATECSIRFFEILS